MTAAPRDIVIAGASVAGLSAADELRARGFDGSITILSDEQCVPYDRPPLSKSMLTGAQDPEPMPLRPADHFDTNRLDLRIGHAAAGLDIDKHNVVTSDGDVLSWDGLIIATGSRPRELRTNTGEALPVLRRPDDLTSLRHAAATHGDITVIGSSFIGLEIAGSLREVGADVTVLGMTSVPLGDVVGPEVATDIRDLHLARGVKMRSGSRVTSAEGQPGAYELELSNGTVHRTSYALAGIGVQPNVEWLNDAGVELDDGVVCDSAGRTNIPGVYAAGDVARFEHPFLGGRARLGHWTNAMQQGRLVAGNLLSGKGEPHTAVPYYWTDQYERKFHSYGRWFPGDEAIVAEGALGTDEYLVLYGNAGAFHCVFSCGRQRSLRGYRKLLHRGGSWGEALELAAKSVDATS